MAIKMRTNKKMDATCCECQAEANDSLGMFDICIGGTILTICDLCTDRILSKTLSAIVGINHRVKSPHDNEIIRRRSLANGIGRGVSSK